MKIIWILIIGFSNVSVATEDVERIQVTGSRIKRIHIEGPSPLLILHQEDLENSGYNSVADVLRDTNIAPFGMIREYSGSSISGESFATVHGASALILINGQRVINDPNAEAVDLHLIPIYAVERVEIIKDGSSAIYGSDALGGVINFIMKKNYSGKEYYGRIAPTLYPFYKGGHRVEGATVWGKSYPKGSVTGSLQFRYNDSILASNRVWSETLISPTSIHPVFITEDGSVTFSDSCPQENRRQTNCIFNYAKYLHTLPKITQLSGYLQGNYKWKGIEFYSHILPSFKRTSYDFPPLPGSVELKSGHKLSVKTGLEGTLKNRFKEAGNREMTTNYLTLDTSFGVKGYLSSEWDWDLSVKASGTYKYDQSANLLVRDTITELIYKGMYDPYTKDKLDLQKALYTSKDHNSSMLFLVDLLFSGNVGPVDTALGAQTYYTNYTETADDQIKANNIISQAGSDGSGSRKVGSIFAEANYAPLESLEIQLAGRGDYYSDLNKLKDQSSKGVFTFNPKAAFRFQPIDSFLLRGSIGKAFIAPTLHSLYGTTSIGFPYLLDSVACFNELKAKQDTTGLDDDLVKDFISDQKETFEQKNLNEETKKSLESLAQKLPNKEFCVPSQFQVELKKNSELKETQGLSASVGSVVQFSDHMSVSVDGWYLKTYGSPSSGVNDDTIKVELKKGNEFVKQHGITINRDSTHPYKPILRNRTDGLYGVDSKLVNIASSELSGLDISLSSFFPNNYYGGNFYLKTEGVVILYSKSEPFPGRGFKDQIGKSGLPRWKNIGTLGWKNNKHNVALQVNSFASVSKANNELESLPMYHRLDLSYQWAMDSKTTINAGWINVLLQNPPIDDTISNDFQINGSLYQVRGPHLYIGFKKLM